MKIRLSCDLSLRPKTLSNLSKIINEVEVYSKTYNMLSYCLPTGLANAVQEMIKSLRGSDSYDLSKAESDVAFCVLAENMLTPGLFIA